MAQQKQNNNISCCFFLCIVCIWWKGRNEQVSEITNAHDSTLIHETKNEGFSHSKHKVTFVWYNVFLKTETFPHTSIFPSLRERESRFVFAWTMLLFFFSWYLFYISFKERKNWVYNENPIQSLILRKLTQTMLFCAC